MSKKYTALFGEDTGFTDAAGQPIAIGDRILYSSGNNRLTETYVIIYSKLRINSSICPKACVVVNHLDDNKNPDLRLKLYENNLRSQPDYYDMTPIVKTNRYIFLVFCINPNDKPVHLDDLNVYPIRVSYRLPTEVNRQIQVLRDTLQIPADLKTHLLVSDLIYDRTSGTSTKVLKLINISKHSHYLDNYGFSEKTDKPAGILFDTFTPFSQFLKSVNKNCLLTAYTSYYHDLKPYAISGKSGSWSTYEYIPC